MRRVVMIVEQVFRISGREDPIVWAELLKGEIAVGDSIHLWTSTGIVDGVVSGIEIHRPSGVTADFVGIQLAGPAGAAVQPNDVVSSDE